ncbi:hypothetical protein Sjap_014842 [Stephania japonica]|uniref:Uncharacterized protein n=1 Tax=Stephania japonica TaxID=461633 RepID=A0AAP0IIH6_9MAGN
MSAEQVPSSTVSSSLPPPPNGSEAEFDTSMKHSDRNDEDALQECPSPTPDYHTMVVIHALQELREVERGSSEETILDHIESKFAEWAYGDLDHKRETIRIALQGLIEEGHVVVIADNNVHESPRHGYMLVDRDAENYQLPSWAYSPMADGKYWKLLQSLRQELLLQHSEGLWMP